MNRPADSRSAGVPVWRLLVGGIALLINVTLVFRLMWGPQSILSYHEFSEQQAELNRKIAEVDAVNAALSRQIRLLQSDEKYVEKMIRHRLNFVRDNEILYLFSDGQESSSQRVQDNDRKN